ncbi:MAG TPA: hypothetical protein VJJ47_00655 [Candidatus Paceibacterota bacterium]
MASRNIQKIQDALEDEGIGITPEEIEATFEGGPGSNPFPLFLFLANLSYDIAEMLFMFSDVSVVGWVLKVILITIPLWVANFAYMWGKIGFIRKRLVRWFLVLCLGSFIPVLSVVFPQVLFVFLAWKHQNKFVQEFYEVIDTVRAAVTNPQRLAGGAAESAVIRARRG